MPKNARPDSSRERTDDVMMQSFSVTYDYPVVFTHSAFAPENRCLIDVLALRTTDYSRHLEVETYTWDVLPAHLRTGSKAADIAREISFCAERLAG